MRILICRQNCGFNGITTWALDLSRELRTRGFDVSFWFLGGPAERLPLFEAVGPTTVGPLPALMQAVERERYDVIHVTSGDLSSLALTLPHHGARLVATNQAQITGVWDSGNCHALTAISKDLAMLEEPFTDLAIDQIYTGISVDRFARTKSVTDERPIIAWIGRANDARQKDFARFTRIAAALPPDKYRIWVVEATGRSPEEFVGEGFAAVTYDRWMKRVAIDDMPAIYQAIAASGGVLLMTSRFEGMGYVVLEAALCGAATVGPNVVGLREAILPEIGTQFDAAASDAEAARVVADWIDANPRSIASCNARADVVAAKFSMSEMVDRYIAVYERPAPVIQRSKAVMPNPLPAGAEYLIVPPEAKAKRHRSLWLPTARELTEAGAPRMALRAAARAVRHDPALLVRPRDALNFLGTTARAALRSIR